MLLAPTLLRHVGPGGSILLSGILERQAAEVIAAFGHADPRIALWPAGADEGWVALAGRRTG
jgi:ribosomal protein L11 methyltransferase